MHATLLRERGPAGPGLAFASILAITDLSLYEGMAVQRAARLANAHGAALKLLFVPSGPASSHESAGRRLEHLAGQLRESLGLRVECVPTRAGALEALAGAMPDADLVVAAQRQEHSSRSLLGGEPLLQLLRRTPHPVLVTRHVPRGDYRHLLAAVDFTPADEALVQLARALEPQAQLELFHAIGTRDEAVLRSAEASERSVRLFRQSRLEQARERMGRLLAVVESRHRPVITTFAHGDAARQLVAHQERCAADLLLVGRKGSSALADFFRAGVASRVLAWSRTDVLVVPHGTALRRHTQQEEGGHAL